LRGLGNGIVIIGFLQLAAVLYFWPREASRPQTWAQIYHYPQRRAGSRRGATLASTVVAMGIIALCLTMALQAYVHGSRARLVQGRRTIGLAAGQEQVEMMRAGGYAALPGLGEHPFVVHTDQALQGRMRVVAGPVARSKEVTVTVRWPQDERMPAGQVTLSTVISARGVGG